MVKLSEQLGLRRRETAIAQMQQEKELTPEEIAVYQQQAQIKEGQVQVQQLQSRISQEMQNLEYYKQQAQLSGSQKWADRVYKTQMIIENLQGVESQAQTGKYELNSLFEYAVGKAEGVVSHMQEKRTPEYKQYLQQVQEYKQKVQEYKTGKAEAEKKFQESQKIQKLTPAEQLFKKAGLFTEPTSLEKLGIEPQYQSIAPPKPKPSEIRALTFGEKVKAKLPEQIFIAGEQAKKIYLGREPYEKVRWYDVPAIPERARREITSGVKQLITSGIERTGYEGMEYTIPERKYPQMVTMGGEFILPKKEIKIFTPGELGKAAGAGISMASLIFTPSTLLGAGFLGAGIRSYEETGIPEYKPLLIGAKPVGIDDEAWKDYKKQIKDYNKQQKEFIKQSKLAKYSGLIEAGFGAGVVASSMFAFPKTQTVSITGLKRVGKVGKAEAYLGKGKIETFTGLGEEGLRVYETETNFGVLARGEKITDIAVKGKAITTPVDITLFGKKYLKEAKLGEIETIARTYTPEFIMPKERIVAFTPSERVGIAISKYKPKLGGFYDVRLTPTKTKFEADILKVFNEPIYSGGAYRTKDIFKTDKLLVTYTRGISKEAFFPKGKLLLEGKPDISEGLIFTSLKPSVKGIDTGTLFAKTKITFPRGVDIALKQAAKSIGKTIPISKIETSTAIKGMGLISIPKIKTAQVTKPKLKQIAIQKVMAIPRTKTYSIFKQKAMQLPKTIQVPRITQMPKEILRTMQVPRTTQISRLLPRTMQIQKAKLKTAQMPSFPTTIPTTPKAGFGLIIPPFWFPSGKAKAIARKIAQKRAKELLYLPSVTAKLLGLSPKKVTEKQARALLRKTWTGMEVRLPVIIQRKRKDEIVAGLTGMALKKGRVKSNKQAVKEVIAGMTGSFLMPKKRKRRKK